MGKQVKPYGTWESPVTAQMYGSRTRLGDVQWDSDGETIVWHESRPTGGVVLCKTGNDAIRELTDSSHKVSGRVGYGGGNVTAKHGQVYFVSNGRIYKQALCGGSPCAITPKFGGSASPTVSHDGKWVAYVHTYEDNDVLAIVDSDGKQWSQKIAQGDDFLMQPTWHPNGTQIAYLAWNHPSMPWNETELRLITLEGNGHGVPIPVKEETLISEPNVAIFQPEFSPDGRYISYISDKTGWGHLYLYDTESGEHTQITNGEIEHSVPAWVQGLYSYGWTGDGGAIYYTCLDKGFASVWMYDVEHKTSLRIRELDSYTTFTHLSVAPNAEKIATVATSSTIPERVISYSAETGVQVVRRSVPEIISGDDLAQAEAITWTGHDGEIVHGLYYPPTNTTYTDTDNHLPPLVVSVHGGPTSHRSAAYDNEVQIFATRGYAVLQVNHRGSTGYGKAYMDKHKGKWGVYDVQDSITGAKHLVDNRLAHPDKLVIMGGSAGGYTTLQALVDEPGFFKAGVCLFGIANQFSLAMDTHKFESRYSDWLLGPLPDAADVYRDRSPIFNAKNITDALIVFQGADDVVVPKNQSDMIIAAVKRNGTPHEYHVYEGEGHGFRKSETRIDFVEKTLKFLLVNVIYA